MLGKQPRPRSDYGKGYSDYFQLCTGTVPVPSIAPYQNTLYPLYQCHGSGSRIQCVFTPISGIGDGKKSGSGLTIFSIA
jgi:hypothetical protein